MQALPPPWRTALLYKWLVPYMQSQHGSFAMNGVKFIGVKVGEWVLLTIMIMGVVKVEERTKCLCRSLTWKSLLSAIHVASKAFLNALLEATNDRFGTLERKIIGGHAVEGIEWNSHKWSMGVASLSWYIDSTTLVSPPNGYLIFLIVILHHF